MVGDGQVAAGMAKVGVIGLGTMGAGIVEVFARGGLEVVGVESTVELAERGRAIVRASTDRAVSRGKLDAGEQQGILDRISVSTTMADLAGADLVVEAVPEVMSIKHEVFSTLDDIVGPETILASNTSSLSITQISAGTAHPERVVGMHFFNPAPVMQLVEVITTLRTPQQLADALSALCVRLGKRPVVVGDRAGFVANYLLFGYLNSAMRLLEHGQVSREDLDTAMRVGAGLPMGPLTLMDLVGLDVCHHIGEVIYAHSRSQLHTPSAMLEQLVAAGRLGRKSGRGFYTYSAPGRGRVAPDALTPTEDEAVAPIRSVAVLGDSALAAELVERLEASGYAVAQCRDASADLSSLAEVDLVIEAQVEADIEAPEGRGGEASPVRDVDDLFSELGQVTRGGAVLATVNTYSTTALAAISGRLASTVGLRLHTPTGNGQVIEVARTLTTDPAVLSAVRQLIAGVGAEAVVSKDRSGLVVDSLLIGHLNDAVRMLDEGYASADDIDAAIQYGLGYPMGPLAMIDHIGADEVLAIAEEMYGGSEGFAPHLAPSPLLVEHVLLNQPFTSSPQA